MWLNARGYTVGVPPMEYAPTDSDWLEYVDEGDLSILMRVEVKQRSLEFTCRADWPFPDGFIVCSRNSFDRAKPKPYAYVILNRAGTHAAFVLGSSRTRWWIERRKDSRYQTIEQEFYFAPLEAVSFAPLETKEANGNPAAA